MKGIFILFLFSVLGCQNTVNNPRAIQNNEPTTTHTSDIKTEHNRYIPGEVIDYLKNNLPGWIIPDTSDYLKAWWSFYDKEQIPYYVTAYLNDDYNDDYAFILIHSNFIRTIILLSSGDTFTHWTDDGFKADFTGNDIQYGLLVETGGEINCFVDGMDKTLILDSDGIALMELEFMSRVYYWSEGKMNVFITK